MEVEIEDIEEQLSIFSVNVTNDCLNKMKEFCFVYNCNAEDIVCHWIAFSTSRKIDMTPSIKLLEQMESEEMKKPKAGKKDKSRNSVTAPVFNSSTIENIDESFEVMDTSNKVNACVNSPGLFSPNSVSPACFTPSMRYASRKGTGEVVCSFGNLEKIEWKHSDEFSVCITSFSDKIIKNSYHFMNEKLRDLASILNDMIQDVAQIFKEKYEIEDWGQIQLPSVETIPVTGRICTDNTGRLNASSIFLEGSQEISSGQTVCLDVSRLEHFSFFPGQIFAGLGVNTTGKKLVLEKIYEGIYPPFCEKIPDLPNCYDSLSVVVAAGPFATSDNLSYSPLEDLLKYVNQHLPHVLILIGPFVDVKNQVIENEDLSKTVQEIFQESVINTIISQIDNLSTKVVIVPSARDAHHFPIYPTPPFKVKHSTKRLYFASDPCILNIEGILFGITSTDILFHLGKEEISFPQLPDRLGRLCNHILTQQNFYPLYPPNEEMNIDYLHFEHSAGIPIMPHILILPSDLRHFIKDINGCCCINSERLTKRVTGGTFSRIKVKRPDKDYKGSMINLIQAEILKI